MLFRTVYGPELEAIYRFVANAAIPPTRQAIHNAFLLSPPNGQTRSTQNIDDALSFLESGKLIVENEGRYTTLSGLDEPFRLKIWRNLRALELGAIEALHALDPLYPHILTELFIRPNRLFVSDVHAEANKLRRVTAIGGLSREKLQTWKRVMAFLGLGRRASRGFMCLYSPNLLLDILKQWPSAKGTLQQFLEEHLTIFLPCQSETGDLPRAIEEPLKFLEKQGAIALTPLQDSPGKPYLGERKIKQIIYQGGDYAG